ncbi:hypothetical protein F5887DRAFT_1070908 [Amanita rubescens]|nr:hypothetical protein F5887DRAFT_1070908 [Amanita rubescens]
MRFTLIVTALAGIAAFANAQRQQSPIPGTHFIVNSVPSPAGDRLAATFQDGQKDVTVTPLTGSEAQRWIISDADTNGAQFIISVTAQSEAAAAGDNAVIVLPKNTFAWTIRNLTSEYFTSNSQFWGLDNPDDNANVDLGPSTGSQTQNWVLDLLEY